MLKKPKTEQSIKAIRVTEATHKAVVSYAKRKDTTVDQALRLILRAAKVAIPLLCVALLRAEDAKPPAIPVELQLTAAKLQAEEMALKQLQAEWQKRMAALQAGEQELIHKLTTTCAGPKWRYAQVPDEIGTKFVCESAPVEKAREGK